MVAYTRLFAPTRLQGNADVIRLVEDNLEQDRSMARTVDGVLEETFP
jgi:hypothetical protein